jgi:hypothetical protein
MKVIQKLILILGLGLLVTACDRAETLEISPGTDVVVHKRDGVEVRGTLVEVDPSQIVVQAGDVRTLVPRREIRTIAAEPARGSTADTRTPAAQPVGTSGDADPDSRAEGEGRGPIARLFDTGPEYREVTIPADTLLPAALRSPVASDGSASEDAVRATLRRPLVVDGAEVLPAGTTVLGHVIDADRSGRVKGRASVSFRFNRIDTPEDGRVAITSAPITRVAAGSKKKDAATIGAGAAGGAIVGGLIGGREGAAKGAAVGGAAGTGVVLSTRGQEVRLAEGAPLSIRLTRPLTLRVAVER